MLTDRTPSRRGDGGFSLVELLVVIVLLGVVSTIVMVTLKSGFRSTTLVQGETESSAELQRSVERIARELRVADPLEAAVPAENRVQVRVFRDGACFRHIYREEAGQLVQYTQSPLLPAPPPAGSPSDETACATAAPASLTGLPRTVLISNLTPATTVFRYFDRNGVQVAFPGSLPRDVAQVEIALSRPGGGSTPLTATTRVDLRNKQEAPE